MLLALLFGLNPIAAFVIGSVAYATSSSITAKMLEEGKRIANPETEFILALLIFEDLVALCWSRLLPGYSQMQGSQAPLWLPSYLRSCYLPRVLC